MNDMSIKFDRGNQKQSGTFRSAMMRQALILSGSVALLVTCPSLAAEPEGISNAAPDPVVFTFVTVGDSRSDRKLPGINAHDAIWQQSTKALSRIIREAQAQKPNAFFFNGDMIMGYTTSEPELDRQYAYWRGMVACLFETGTYVVPVPGNHEMQIKIPVKGGKPTDDPAKVAQKECEDAWRANMGDLILDTNLWAQLTGAPVEAWNPANAPAIGGEDGIKTDQRGLTFSFDSKQIHFVVINTDAVGNDSHAPVHWLAEDFAGANQRGCRAICVFGHKMDQTYHFNPKFPAKGLDLFPENAAAFWKLIGDYHATYFCGHEHIYHAMQPEKNAGNESWQVIVGSGGSPFEAEPGASGNPNDRKYAWAFVKVFASGRMQMEVRAFDENYGPTETLETLELIQKL
jgi:hypothetical protein